MIETVIFIDFVQVDDDFKIETGRKFYKKLLNIYEINNIELYARKP